MSSNTIYYVYKLVHIADNSYYYGSRKSTTPNPYDDLGIKYFSSSKMVKQIGFNNFYYGIIESFSTFEECYWYEQELIQHHINDSLCLNKSYYIKENGSRIFSMTNKKQTREHIEKRTAHQKGKKRNITISPIQQKKMQESKRKKYPDGFKHSAESNEKNRISHLGKQDTDETRLKRSLAAKGKPKPWLKDRIISDETIIKQNESRKKNRASWSDQKREEVNNSISAALKGKPRSGKTICSAPFICRISDKKTLNKGNAARVFPDLKQYF